MEKTYILKIYRGTPGKQYWEEFELGLRPMSNIISGLMEIEKNPINRKGKKVEPVVWESGCLEEVCGSCSMLVNGYPRQSCTAVINKIIKETGSRVITVAPFTKFPLIRDLMVDRTSMFDNLKKVHAWIDVDGIYDKGPGPKISPEKQEIMYTLSTCMTCGCCVEGCPQASLKNDFVGPQIFGQVRLFNAHPTGKMQKGKRLRPMMEKGGISDCGNAQNCVRVCPKKIPLTDAIAAIGRDVTLQALSDLFSFPDRE
ncbi:succinate dehydrogenase iron-sulfur subunit [Waddlia chondrophila]|uniref:succinate dehydrogenase n=1 Tax=Waddlia chondrophila (strain ATCC VR-1470 / WSU 86-1044) TaxID=716544 RepID=D6YSS6_WADCW|nr:succinate dehydrogenase iron-sulfur subunit [Waddlia chondrophila]ADI39121.1 succinate dehydrogenase iron-sulfur protein subunit B [Waddlia chondrophila WSU 86-1044]